MTIHAVIWDLGGVLLRTEDPTPRERLAAKLGLTRRDLEDIFFNGDSGARAQRGEISAEQHRQNMRHEFNLSQSEMDEFWDLFWAGDRLDLDLVNFVRALRHSRRTALLSNAFSDLRAWITQQGRFEDAFDDMLISAELGMVKPDPRIYRIALNRLDIEPSQAIFIDDFTHNVEGAKSVGMHAIHFKDPVQVRIQLNTLLAAEASTQSE